MTTFFLRKDSHFLPPSSVDGEGVGIEEEHKTLEIFGFRRNQKELEFRRKAIELGFGRSQGEKGCRTEEAAAIANRMERTKRGSAGRAKADG